MHPLVNSQGELVPELAENWEGSAGATRWVFRLRRGVTFHNGKPFTPRDVIDTLNLDRGENSKSGLKTMLQPIMEMRADGHDLHFTLAQGNAAIADQVVVMQNGRVVEQGPKTEMFHPPHHEYTELLLSSVPEMDPDWLDRVLASRAGAAD